MYIFISGIISFLLGLLAEVNLSAFGEETQIPTIITVVSMGCFILYDNRRRGKWIFLC